MHADAAEQIETRRSRVAAWLDRRREDFERQCQNYRSALAHAGIEAELKIPFDAEHPSNSYGVLAEASHQCVVSYLSALTRRLNDQLQVIRYALQVQQLPLVESETRVRTTLNQAKLLEQQITPEMAQDLDQWNTIILESLATLTRAEQDLVGDIRRAVQPRPAEGSEVDLLRLLSSSSSGRLIDLRELIIHLLDRGSETVDLDAIMIDLRSLFQKNQISIHVRPLQDNR